ncbi:MAG: response regulator [Candidatus Altiarchaeota archaeon]
MQPTPKAHVVADVRTSVDDLLKPSPRLEVPDSLKPLRAAPTILVVEDDDLTREMTIKELGRHYKDAVFLEARSGKEATDILSKRAVDCMVLDFCLGDKPDEIHGEGVLAYLGENRLVVPTVVRSGSWSNPETVAAREQITEGIIRGVYTAELKDRELRQIAAVPGLPVLVDFMCKGDNFDILAARLDIVRLHSGREAEKLGQKISPLESVVGALIKDILAGLNVGRRETTPTKYWISRLEGAGNDFFMFFNRFARRAKQEPGYAGNETLRKAVEAVEAENTGKRFSFESLMIAAGSSHPNAHALLNRLLLCRDLVAQTSRQHDGLGAAAAEYAPGLFKLYDSALGYYRNSKKRERTQVNIAEYMAAVLPNLSSMHSVQIGYRAPWEDVGSANVDPVLFDTAFCELVTNACKAAKQAEKPEVGITGCSFSRNSLPPAAMEFFQAAGVKGKFVYLAIHNNGRQMEGHMMEALNRGDTSVLGESAFGTGGTGLKSLMADILPNVPGFLQFEKRGESTGATIFIPEGEATETAKPAGIPYSRAMRYADDDEPPKATGRVREAEPLKTSSGPAKARVILVDDFREFPEMFKEMLDGTFGGKIEAVVCTTVNEFLKASETPFDAVVSDYVLEAPHLAKAVEDEEKCIGRTGRTVLRIARERNPKALTVIYSIDDVYDPKSPGAEKIDPNLAAPADPQNTDWGLNKGDSGIMVSDGIGFRRPSPDELGKLGIASGENWSLSLTKILENRLAQKLTT